MPRTKQPAPAPTTAASRRASPRAARLALELQLAARHADIPARACFEAAVGAALGRRRRPAELTIRVVGRAEARRLNRRYRDQDKPTNVLSFPAAGLAAIAPYFLGDIVICAPLVAQEARAQGKSVAAHWTHLVVHGVLHLLGYDHVADVDAALMEEMERAALARLGLPDPYAA